MTITGIKPAAEVHFHLNNAELLSIADVGLRIKD